jgi:hypothetical protein
MISSVDIDTVPRRPSTMRTRSALGPCMAMKSITTTMPASVSTSVSSTIVSPRYRRVVRRTVSCVEGPRSQRPCSGRPRSAAKQAPESKRGQHNQSIDPVRETSAAVSQSPIMAYCSIGVDVCGGVIACPRAESAPFAVEQTCNGSMPAFRRLSPSSADKFTSGSG